MAKIYLKKIKIEDNEYCSTKEHKCFFMKDKINHEGCSMSERGIHEGCLGHIYIQVPAPEETEK